MENKKRGYWKMCKGEQNMEKKKKSKTPIIVVIIILLAAAGFGYYKFVYQPQQMAKYELAESEVVETELVAEVDWAGTEIDAYKEVFASMAENDALYYHINSKNEVWGPPYEIYQTNKEEFSEKSPKSPEKAVKEVNDGISKFLNYSYKSLPSPLFQTSSADGMIFGKLDVSSEAQSLIEPQFGGSIAEYFKSHELVLKCDDCKVTQIGVETNADGSIYYYCNIAANVLTEDCIGDMSDIGIFANKGETKQVNINAHCIYDENSKELFADIVLFE